VSITEAKRSWRAASASAGDDLTRLITEARAAGRDTLSEPEAKQLLQAHGIPVPAGRFVTDPEQAPAVLHAIMPPVVVKAVAHDLTHKSDAGAVIFPVYSGTEAEDACRTIRQRVRLAAPDAVLQGFLIEAFRPAQTEWILALRMDPHFGAVIMFGLGGIYVDVLRQVSFRVAPLRSQDAEALLSEKPATRILDGMRGRKPADRAALIQTILRLSDLAAHPAVARDVSVIEINPLVASETGVLALDALIVLRPQEFS
jgi:succinyl-CoA synthetase beta subunit